MNKTLFAVVCVACGAGGMLVLWLGLAGAFPRRNLGPTMIIIVVVLPAVAWLRLRIEARRKHRQAEFEAMAMQAQAQPLQLPLGHGEKRVKQRRRRRRFVAGGMLAVGLLLTFVTPHRAANHGRDFIGWPVVLVGAILLAGELLGRNVFRGTALDNRLDLTSTRDRE